MIVKTTTTTTTAATSPPFSAIMDLNNNNTMADSTNSTNISNINTTTTTTKKLIRRRHFAIPSLDIAAVKRSTPDGGICSGPSVTRLNSSNNNGFKRKYFANFVNSSGNVQDIFSTQESNSNNNNNDSLTISLPPREVIQVRSESNNIITTPTTQSPTLTPPMKRSMLANRNSLQGGFGSNTIVANSSVSSSTSFNSDQHVPQICDDGSASSNNNGFTLEMTGFSLTNNHKPATKTNKTGGLSILARRRNKQLLSQKSIEEPAPASSNIVSPIPTSQSMPALHLSFLNSKQLSDLISDAENEAEAEAAHTAAATASALDHLARMKLSSPTPGYEQPQNFFVFGQPQPTQQQGHGVDNNNSNNKSSNKLSSIFRPNLFRRSSSSNLFKNPFSSCTTLTGTTCPKESHSSSSEPSSLPLIVTTPTATTTTTTTPAASASAASHGEAMTPTTCAIMDINSSSAASSSSTSSPFLFTKINHARRSSSCNVAPLVPSPR